MDFNKERHEYKKNGIIFTPVSDVISKATPEFEREQISKAVANRDGLTQEEVLSDWDFKKEIACDLGNAIHKTIEHWIIHNTELNNSFLNSLVDKFPLSREGLNSEKMVYDEDTYIAGTIDIIEGSLEAERGDNREDVNLYDIKTNSGLEESHGKLLEPFDDLENSKLNKYRMQLTLYKLLIEKMNNVNVKNLSIIQFDFDDMDWNMIEIEPVEKILELGLKGIADKLEIKPKKSMVDEAIINL
ncbi:MAG: hypothetical protein ACOC5T_05795 [Elusimicrobiota bacterium]